ncbi:MAG: 4Fe-4S binding protein, partial [Tissierellia bacterium]|nr:4Fe-4S binding protein [Tissierellia bacterium]
DYKLPYSCMLCGYCTEVCPQIQHCIGIYSKGTFP